MDGYGVRPVCPSLSRSVGRRTQKGTDLRELSPMGRHTCDKYNDRDELLSVGMKAHTTQSEYKEGGISGPGSEDGYD